MNHLKTIASFTPKRLSTYVFTAFADGNVSSDAEVVDKSVSITHALKLSTSRSDIVLSSASMVLFVSV